MRMIQLKEQLAMRPSSVVVPVLMAVAVVKRQLVQWVSLILEAGQDSMGQQPKVLAVLVRRSLVRVWQLRAEPLQQMVAPPVHLFAWWVAMMLSPPLYHLELDSPREQLMSLYCCCCFCDFFLNIYREEKNKQKKWLLLMIIRIRLT